jgi:hypothetical protein
VNFIKKRKQRNKSEMNEFGSKTNDTEFIKALRKGILLVACRVCGQCHPQNSTHLYDYEGIGYLLLLLNAILLKAFN